MHSASIEVATRGQGLYDVTAELRRAVAESGVADGREMEAQLGSQHFDAIVLDLMLPGESGLSLCKRLRAQSDIPILMISARNDLTERIISLEIGADDFLAKPFDIRELVACDAVYMLPGWPASRGARLEHHVAVELGLHVIDGDAAEQCLLRPSSDAAGFPPGASALGGLCLADGEGSET